MNEGDSLPVIEKLVTQELIHKYAEAAGDFNPIHVDEGFAATSPFGGTIAHGMMIVATISEMMTVAFQADWLTGGRLKIRFRTPVRPGDTVSTFGRVKAVRDIEGAKELVCSVGVRKKSGEDAITGDATVMVS